VIIEGTFKNTQQNVQYVSRLHVQPLTYNLQLVKAVSISGSYRTMVVRLKIWRLKLVEIAR